MSGARPLGNPCRTMLAVSAVRGRFVVHRPAPGISEEVEPMFGTIARATPKPGQEGKLETFLQEWQRDIRPKIPGPSSP